MSLTLLRLFCLFLARRVDERTVKIGPFVTVLFLPMVKFRIQLIQLHVVRAFREIKMIKYLIFQVLKYNMNMVHLRTRHLHLSRYP